MNSDNVQDVLIMHRLCSVSLILHNTSPVLQICADLAMKRSDLAYTDSGMFSMNTQHVQDALITHRPCSVHADLTVYTSCDADLC